MRRDPSRLTTPEFDLLIVGAGIYGATAAWDATQRGLRVALIDKGDFGSGTSFNNAKTVHGGVRYKLRLSKQNRSAVALHRPSGDPRQFFGNPPVVRLNHGRGSVAIIGRNLKERRTHCYSNMPQIFPHNNP